MSRRARRLLPTLLAAGLLTVTACSGEESSVPDAETTPHSHGPGNEHVSLLVGDGTRDSEVGYRITDVSLPRSAGTPGEVRFTIEDADGQPLRAYLTEQSKDLHLYVVRDDLAVFRHLHPALGDDGAWSGPLTLPKAGDYRVIAEFVARDEGGNGDFVMVGADAKVPGTWQREDVDLPAVGTDGVVEVTVEGTPGTGDLGQLGLRVRDSAGRAVTLGSYLGASGHVTAFHAETGSVVHMHPLGSPQVDGDGTRLTFHTEFERPGDYLAFVQVRVDGFLHTLPVRIGVT